MAASDDLVSGLTANTIDLMRLEARTRRILMSALRRLELELEARIRRFDLENVASDAVRRRRAEQLIREARRILARRYDGFQEALRVQLQGAARGAHELTARLLNEVFTVDLFAATIDPATARALASRTRILNLPQSEWWAQQREGTRRAFTREIRQGVLQGETNEQLLDRVVGRRTGRRIQIEVGGRIRRIPERTGGVLETSRRHARTLVRTATNAVSNGALENTYRENSDVVKGVGTVTTLDGRTSDICIARTGAAWNLETGEPLPESTRDEPFPGFPPWHPNERTVLYPITYSFDEMIERAGGERLDLLEEVPGRVRASFTGQVSDVRTFDDFLRARGDAFAARKLGPGRFRLWAEGRITLSQLIDQSGRPLTLAELLARFGSAA